jgi:hypothetical protein
MTDPYDIPANMFGPSPPEEHFGLVGRVVMVAALIELRAGDLLTALDQAPQAKHAGKPASDHVKKCRKLLTDQGLSYHEAGLAMLDKLDYVLNERNAIVHSVWPSPTIDYAYGWRPVTEGKRSPTDKTANQPLVSYPTSAPMLSNVVARQVALVAELEHFIQLAHDSWARIALGPGLN